MSPSLPLAVPPKTDQRWKAVVSNGPIRPVKVLAVKFMLTRMTKDVKRDPSAATIAANVDELHGFFTKNQQMVADDIANLFG